LRCYGFYFGCLFLSEQFEILGLLCLSSDMCVLLSGSDVVQVRSDPCGTEPCARFEYEAPPREISVFH